MREELKQLDQLRMEDLWADGTLCWTRSRLASRIAEFPRAALAPEADIFVGTVAERFVGRSSAPAQGHPIPRLPWFPAG